jgi:MFS family permease
MAGPRWSRYPAGPGRGYRALRHAALATFRKPSRIRRRIEAEPTMRGDAAVASQSVLRLRDFRLYLGVRFMGSVAMQMQSVAVGWQIYAITGDPLSLGLVGLAQFLPMAGFILPAGDITDRFDRRIILAASYVVQALSALSLLVLALRHETATWPFYVVLVAFGAARGFTAPAIQSFAPFLVPVAMLPRAVAWSSSANTTAVIIGPALGGVLYVFGAAAVYTVCLVLFTAMAGSIAAIRSRAPVHVGVAGETAFDRFRAGIRYIGAKRMMLGAILLDLFAVLLGGAVALLPVYARDILQVGPEGLGVLRSAQAVGAAVTALVLANFPLRRHAGAAMFGGVALFGVATIVFGLSESFFVSLAALAVMGAADMINVFVRSSIVQLATPDPMRGRISAVNMLFVGASNELGEFESGVTAAWFGTVPSVVIGGLGTLAVVGTCAWLFPELRKVDRLHDVKPG